MAPALGAIHALNYGTPNAEHGLALYSRAREIASISLHIHTSRLEGASQFFHWPSPYLVLGGAQYAL
jgi:hypothetical protein